MILIYLLPVKMLLVTDSSRSDQLLQTSVAPSAPSVTQLVVVVVVSGPHADSPAPEEVRPHAVCRRH